MKERIEAELKLLREYYPDIEYKNEGGHWFRIPSYPVEGGWSRAEAPVAFEVKITYPGTQPYGIYVPSDLTHGGEVPKDVNVNPTQPPFPGRWILLSWQPNDGEWRPTGDLLTGSNLLHWVRGFAVRFREGR